MNVSVIENLSTQPASVQHLLAQFLRRFWSKVNKNGPIPQHCPELGNCWIWTACKPNGYGRITINKKGLIASRVSWEIHYGIIPKDEMACHKCDNPACIRPTHLFLGNHSANMLDMHSKGRGPQMTREQMGCKLTVQQIEEMRCLYVEHQIPLGKLSAKFSVSRMTVWNKVKDLVQRKSVQSQTSGP